MVNTSAGLALVQISHTAVISIKLTPVGCRSSVGVMGLSIGWLWALVSILGLGFHIYEMTLFLLREV